MQGPHLQKVASIFRGTTAVIIQRSRWAATTSLTGSLRLCSLRLSCPLLLLGGTLISLIVDGIHPLIVLLGVFQPPEVDLAGPCSRGVPAWRSPTWEGLCKAD